MISVVIHEYGYLFLIWHDENIFGRNHLTGPRNASYVKRAAPIAAVTGPSTPRILAII